MHSLYVLAVQVKLVAPRDLPNRGKGGTLASRQVSTNSSPQQEQRSAVTQALALSLALLVPTLHSCCCPCEFLLSLPSTPLIHTLKHTPALHVQSLPWLRLLSTLLCPASVYLLW